MDLSSGGVSGLDLTLSSHNHIKHLDGVRFGIWAASALVSSLKSSLENTIIIVIAGDRLTESHMAI